MLSQDCANERDRAAESAMLKNRTYGFLTAENAKVWFFTSFHKTQFSHQKTLHSKKNSKNIESCHGAGSAINGNSLLLPKNGFLKLPFECLVKKKMRCPLKGCSFGVASAHRQEKSKKHIDLENLKTIHFSKYGFMPSKVARTLSYIPFSPSP